MPCTERTILAIILQESTNPAPFHPLPFHPFGLRTATHPHPGGADCKRVGQAYEDKQSSNLILTSYSKYEELPQQTFVVLAQKLSNSAMNDARHGRYCSLLFVFVAVT